MDFFTYTYKGKETINMSLFIRRIGYYRSTTGQIQDYLTKEDIVYEEDFSPEVFASATVGLVPEDMSIDEFLGLRRNETSPSNLDRIFNRYSKEEKEEYRLEYESGSVPFIKPGTSLLIPKTGPVIEKLKIYADNLFLLQESFSNYVSNNLSVLMNSDGYTPVENLSLPNKAVDVQVRNENVVVWVWSKALGKIIDLSQFVRRVTTNKGRGAGTFSLEFDPILDLERVEHFGSEVLNTYPILKGRTDVKNLYGYDREDYFDFTTFETNTDFFESNLQMNDLFFIRFERLKLEQRLEKQKDNNFEIDKSALNTGRIWDMIGLVDRVNVSFNAISEDKRLTIDGRDLTKVLVDDASYFMGTVFQKGSSESFIYSGNEDDNVLKRNLVSGAYDFYFYSRQYKSIRDVISFTFNHLASLEIVDNQLFSSYGSARSVRREISGVDNDQIGAGEPLPGIWSIISSFVDPILDSRRVVDSSLSNPDSNLLAYLNKVCHMPFVEFYGDTNGAFYDFVVRQPPFDRQGYQSALDNAISTTSSFISNKDVLSYSLDFDDRYYSWYQIHTKNAVTGFTRTTSLGLIPIIYLEEYAKVFGNKRLIQEDNYLGLRALNGDGKQKKVNTNLFAEALLNDLKYLIESTAYLPFTRKGTITINGDRRIKRGTFVRFLPTDEYFYVEEVTQNVSFSKDKVDRATVLKVERGMKSEYIRGKESVEGFPILTEKKLDNATDRIINKEETEASASKAVGGNVRVEASLENSKSKKYSYFNIVDTDLIIRNILKRIENPNYTETVSERNYETRFGVNIPVFNFFLQKQQFKQ